MVINMTINVSQDGDASIIKLPGQLDVLTSPGLKQTLADVVSNSARIEIDFSETELVTSAGLRVLLQAQKNVQTSGKRMVLKHMSPDVMEVFELTGVTKIFEII